MATVKFTYALKRFYPDLADIQVEGGTVAEILQEVEARYPGLTDYLIEEQGALRKHVNIFVAGVMVSDRKSLSDKIAGHEEIHIMQALSGG